MPTVLFQNSRSAHILKKVGDQLFTPSTSIYVMTSGRISLLLDAFLSPSLHSYTWFNWLLLIFHEFQLLLSTNVYCIEWLRELLETTLKTSFIVKTVRFQKNHPLLYTFLNFCEISKRRLMGRGAIQPK